MESEEDTPELQEDPVEPVEEPEIQEDTYTVEVDNDLTECPTDSSVSREQKILCRKIGISSFYQEVDYVKYEDGGESEELQNLTAFDERTGGYASEVYSNLRYYYPGGSWMVAMSEDEIAVVSNGF